MEHFPKTLTREETANLVERLIDHYNTYGFTYFATEVLKTGEFIGFIGLVNQPYKTEFSPGTDIGWRLKKSAWGKGYATEGAKRCLDLAFNEIGMEKVFATCTMNNRKSEQVMLKIGMTRKGTFNHPSLRDSPKFEKCLWYQIEASERKIGETDGTLN
jgi:RimJ/RimL family protein N-acetyltransferase